MFVCFVLYYEKGLFLCNNKKKKLENFVENIVGEDPTTHREKKGSICVELEGKERCRRIWCVDREGPA